MPDEAGEMPEGTPAGQAPATTTAAASSGNLTITATGTAPVISAEADAGQDPEDDFDKDRALATIRKLREGEKAAKATQKELEQIRAQLRAHEDAKLSEAERIAKQLETLQSQVAAKEAREAELTKSLQEQALRFEVVNEAAKLQIVDPEAAYKLLDLSAIERDDDGRPVNVAKALKDLVKAKPYLVPQQAAPANPTNPARADRQAAADPVNLPFGAPPVSIWELGREGAIGGGVHWNEKPG